ncbi:APC membrane recruitment protein 2 [Rhineura floridana]|uniref:APC membrane recruitment protein 2 n=1 Tax=Rhineura floridana TaxID=261503 RepID=UPI002AC84DCC|nr:APC membrane recruitment protein 2 [Rhineura floridana]
MEVHCDCAEPTTVGEQLPPSGKLNKTAFKLFKRRKSGGSMPSIFGVRSSGKGKISEGGGGQAGMVRSKTHDGLAEVVLESGKKEEPGGGGDDQFVVVDGGGGGVGRAKDDSAAAAASCSAAVGKSHSFFSLLRKNGRSSEGGKGERPKGRGGLKGLFSSMRWHRRDKPGGGAKEDEAGESSEGQPSLLMPGSLTASLECIKEEAPRPTAAAPQSPPGLTSEDQLLPPQDTEAIPGQEQQDLDARELQHSPPTPPGVDLPRIQFQMKESHPQPQDGDGQETKEDSAITGCGDIIADQEDDVGSGSGASGSDKSAPGVGRVGASKKPPGVVTYQGGGEEMASPEQVRDTCTPVFWDMLSQTEKSQETLGGKESLEASKDGSCTKKVQDGSTTGKPIGVNQIPVHHNHRNSQKTREKEQQEAIPSSDEGYWDSTTPGPEEDNTSSIQKEVIPRDSYSGDALYDLYADPDENTATVTSAEDATSVTCCKPLSPVTSTCPVKTHTTSLKDSKIPISIKHFTSPHASHGPDTSNSHHTAHHQPTKSEIPRTKIPVSKVLVHRASYRSLGGTTGKTATYHESAKK